MNHDGHDTVLLVDDDSTASESLVRSIKRRKPNFKILSASSAQQALDIQKDLLPGVAVVDLSIDPSAGPKSGLELIADLMAFDPSIRILVLTGHGAEEYGIAALQRGAASFLNKPADPEHLIALIRDGLTYSNLKRQFQQLGSKAEKLQRLIGITSRNERMLAALESAAFAASHSQPVLLAGETGTGKGVLAQAIHRASPGKNGPFIRFQPSFSGQDLVSSELFGHERGAFTGATERRKGLIETAHRGTLFIDEVDELPTETQLMLLNVLQEKVFRKLGSNHELHSDFRLISATNQDIEKTLQKEKLRADFFHRIAHLTIEIPPLRDRLEDIEDLALYFHNEIATKENIPINGLSPSALSKLTSHSWPGNVRELQAVVEGAVYKARYHERRIIEAEDIAFQKKTQSKNNNSSFRDQVRDYELRLIHEALARHGGNQSKAADSLSMDRSTLRRLLAKKDS